VNGKLNSAIAVHGGGLPKKTLRVGIGIAAESGTRRPYSSLGVDFSFSSGTSILFFDAPSISEKKFLPILFPLSKSFCLVARVCD
jgi:hypothetical protein